MSYCTQTDVETRIGPADLVALADHDGDEVADAEVIDQAIRDAAALIDSYLGVRFSVPVSPVPEVLKARAVNLAVYFLRLGRNSVTEDVRQQHRDDIDWLRQVAGGTVSLGIEPRPNEGSAAAGVRYQTQPRSFGRGEPL